MVGRPESKDDSVGPSAYSPDKDKVLVKNPAWSFPGKHSSKSKKDGGIEPIKERIGKRTGGRLDFAKNHDGPLDITYAEPAKFGDNAKTMQFTSSRKD